MAGQSVDSATDYLWFSYAQQIKTHIAGSGDIGPNAIYVRPLTTQAIASGEGVPPEVTNYGVYQGADNMLTAGCPVYVPGARSYCQSLLDYLEAVELEKDDSTDAQLRLKKAQDDAAWIKKQYNDLWDETETMYTKRTKKRDPTEDELLAWAKMSSPEFSAMYERQRQATNAVSQVWNEIAGVGAGQLYIRKEALKDAINNPTKSNPFNMRCLDADAGTIKDIQQGAKVDESRILHLPRYSLQTGLNVFMNDWVANRKKTDFKGLDMEFSTSGAERSDWSTLGFSKTEAKVSASVGCFFRTDASGKWEDSSSASDLSQSGTSVKVKINFVGLGKLDIQCGPWDVPGVKTIYKKLYANVKPDTSELIQPKAMLLGFDPEMTVTFDASTYRRVKSEVEHAREMKANVSIFGFCASAAASGSSSSGDSSKGDSVSMNDASLSITIPRTTSRFPVCIGVLGARV